ncbi:HET-domain-containing protein [Venturia nashicola]|nr:HET-domain-containing protein [Venturia nashicola]
MRLLNSHSLELEEYFGESVPAYVILSHRWESEEVSYQDIISGKGKFKTGYAKIIGCCILARDHGYRYVWIDTCCIDKTSSAELTEAINSMFNWYQKANRKTQWLERGWTLQELLAPRTVDFYDAHWENIGSKASLAGILSQATGISVSALLGAKLSAFTVADRLSWASRRRTTRAEDKSYCLLGIFGVNMPLLYGEGEERSFLRLQEEILKITEDYTIFAWSDDHAYDTTRGYCPGLLASSVSKFNGFSASQGLGLGPLLTMKHSDLVKSDEEEYPDEPPTLTSRGLRITLLILRISRREVLTKALILHLERCSGGSNLYRRITPGPRGLSTLEYHEHPISFGEFESKAIYIKQERQFTGSTRSNPMQNRELAVLELACMGVDLIEYVVPGRIDEQTGKHGNMILLENVNATGCDVVALICVDSCYALVTAGFRNGRPWCEVKRTDCLMFIKNVQVSDPLLKKPHVCPPLQKILDADDVNKEKLCDQLLKAASQARAATTSLSDRGFTELPHGDTIAATVERHPRRLVRMDFMPMPEWRDVFSLTIESTSDCTPRNERSSVTASPHIKKRRREYSESEDST